MYFNLFSTHLLSTYYKHVHTYHRQCWSMLTAVVQTDMALEVREPIISGWIFVGCIRHRTLKTKVSASCLGHRVIGWSSSQESFPSLLWSFFCRATWSLVLCYDLLYSWFSFTSSLSTMHKHPETWTGCLISLSHCAVCRFVPCRFQWASDRFILSSQPNHKYFHSVIYSTFFFWLGSLTNNR